jgi:hypothetical protein
VSRLPQTSDDLTTRLRDDERRIAELEARGRPGVAGGRQILTSSSGPHSGTTVTDFSRTIEADDTLEYAVCLDGQVIASNLTSIWTLEFLVNGVDTDRLFVHENASRLWCNTRKLWHPTAGTKVCTVQALLVSGSATLTIEGGGAGPLTRQFWLEIVGPR